MRRNQSNHGLIVWLKDHWSCLALIVITAGGLVLRVWEIDFGLPHRYHIDEPAYVVTALRLGSGELHIDYPSTPQLTQIVFLGVFGILFLLQKLTGTVQSPTEFGMSYQFDPTLFYLCARMMSALCGTASIVILYLVGRRVFKHSTALLASLFFAITFLHVRDSHFAVPDALVTLLALMFAVLCVRYWQKPNCRNLFWSSIVCGMAIGAKNILPLPLIVPLFIAWVAHIKVAALARLSMAAKTVSLVGITLLGGYLIAQPSLVINFPVFIKNAMIVGTMVKQGFMGFLIDPLPPWLFYLRDFDWGVGWPLALVALTGILTIIARRRRDELFILTLPVAYYVGLSIYQVPQARYALPIFPFLALFAAYALTTIFERSAKIPISLRVAGLTVTIALLSVIPLYNSIRFDYLLEQTDTRTLAKQWIENYISEGAKIATQWHGPPLSIPSDPEPNSKRVYDVMLLDPFSSDKRLYSLDYYRESGIEYLVVSSFIYNLVRVNSEEEQLRRAFYASLDEKAELLAEFKPYQGDDEPPFYFDQMVGPLTDLERFERPGPTIKIYRVNR